MIQRNFQHNMLRRGITMVKLDKDNREQYTQTILKALQKKKINNFREIFLDLHPSDQVDVFISLEKSLRKRCYKYLSPTEFAFVFEGLNTYEQHLIFEELDELYSSDMFNDMFTDDVVTFLSSLEHQTAEHILNRMEQEKAKEIRILLAYTEETAGAIMTKEFVSISASEKASLVIEQLRDEAPEAEIIYYNYVVNEKGQLVGVISLRDLIVAPLNETIDNIMNTRVISVDEDMDQEEVALVIQKYDILAVPVVSKDNRLLGIVTVDDVIDILEDETTEDFGEISATKGATDINLSAFTAAKKRSPWILTLMFFGLITAGVIGQFEETLEQVVLLAAFVPMIMDSAGNVGTQSLTVAVRGLALGTIEKSNIWRMIRREFSTGVLIGIASMIAISLIIPIFYSNWVIALVVGVSILATLSVSAVTGAIVPLIINRLNIDPAVASGPFITTINDIIGLFIYFSIATSLLDVL